MVSLNGADFTSAETREVASSHHTGAHLQAFTRPAGRTLILELRWTFSSNWMTELMLAPPGSLLYGRPNHHSRIHSTLHVDLCGKALNTCV